MAVSKRRKSKARTAMRRSQWMASVGTPSVTPCPRCQEPKLPHRVCGHCGYYHDREVLAKETAEEAAE